MDFFFIALPQIFDLSSHETNLFFAYAWCRVARQLIRKPNTAPVLKLFHVPARGIVMTSANEGLERAVKQAKLPNELHLLFTHSYLLSTKEFRWLFRLYIFQFPESPV